MATDILEIFKRSIGKNQRYLLDPSQHLQFCTGVHSLSCELHLSYKATSRPFRRRFGKWHHKTETVGEFLEGKIFWVWLRCTVIKHTCTFVNVLQERQDCVWSAFWFIQLPGIMDVFCFVFFLGLPTCYFPGRATMHWSWCLRQTGCNYPWKIMWKSLELWFAAQELQDLSLKAYLDMLSS